MKDRRTIPRNTGEERMKPTFQLTVAKLNFGSSNQMCLMIFSPTACFNLLELLASKKVIIYRWNDAVGFYA